MTWEQAIQTIESKCGGDVGFEFRLHHSARKEAGGPCTLLYQARLTLHRPGQKPASFLVPKPGEPAIQEIVNAAVKQIDDWHGVKAPKPNAAV